MIRANSPSVVIPPLNHNQEKSLAYSRRAVSEGWCSADMHEREGCAEVQFRSFENELRKIDNIRAYRITVTEQSSDGYGVLN